jgi:hypothetical protein
MIHRKSPELRDTKVFGCPVIFKRYQPHHNADLTKKSSNYKEVVEEILWGFQKIKLDG